MSEIKNVINLVLAADDNYARYLGVALVSIIDNHHDPRPLFFHILDNGITDQNKEYLKVIGESKGAKLKFYEISENLLAACPEVGHLTKTSYARLLIPELLPADITKVIYLDVDIVVLGDIAELYNQDIKGHSLGAVTDVMAKEILRIYFYPGLSGYFNAGVLLIDPGAWRQRNIKERAWEFIAKHQPDLIRSDQDVLNCLFKDDWQPIADRFNVDLKRQSFRAMPPSETVVLHYSDRLKPDDYRFTGRSGHYYFDYLRKTPWSKAGFRRQSFKNFFVRYFYLLVKESKRLLLPCLPPFLLDAYHRLLWWTVQVKK